MAEEQDAKVQQNMASPPPQEERRSGVERRSGADRRAAPAKHYPADRYVFREGERGDFAFIVKEGQVEIVKRSADKEASLGVLGPGEMFGEMALIDSEPRMASARVISGPATLFVISKEQFDSVLALANPFVRKLLKMLADNLRSAARKLEK